MSTDGWKLSTPTMVAEHIDYHLAQHFDCEELAPDSRKEIAAACAKAVDDELARLRRLADAYYSWRETGSPEDGFLLANWYAAERAARSKAAADELTRMAQEDGFYDHDHPADLDDDDEGRPA